MKAKNILMICLFISGLFCLPSKAQQPGENISSQTIRKLGEKHFFSISTIPDDIFRLMQGKTYKKNSTVARSDSHRCARYSEKAIRGKISDRTDETH